MNKKTMYLLGGAAVLYYLYNQSQAQAGGSGGGYGQSGSGSLPQGGSYGQGGGVNGMGWLQRPGRNW
jgi:hypothetical protein